MNHREKRFARLARKAQALLEISAMAPRDVFGELLGYTQSKQPDKYKAWWWARFMFKDIYGIFPRDQDQGPPKAPHAALLEWISLRLNRHQRTSKRLE
jgi:hypothetical protein